MKCICIFVHEQMLISIQIYASKLTVIWKTQFAMLLQNVSMHLGTKNRHYVDSHTLTQTPMHKQVQGGLCLLRRCCPEREMPVETQMVTDGLETNQPGSQDL